MEHLNKYLDTIVFRLETDNSFNARDFTVAEVLSDVWSDLTSSARLWLSREFYSRVWAETLFYRVVGMKVICSMDNGYALALYRICDVEVNRAVLEDFIARRAARTTKEGY